MNEDTLEKIYQERLEEHRISSLAEKSHGYLLSQFYGVENPCWIIWGAISFAGG